jgi:hypothetical protein
MLLNLLTYGLLIAGLVAAAWLAGRMMGVPPARRPNGAVTANPWVDAECAFDRALAEHKRRYYAATLVGRAARLNLPCIDEATPFTRLGQHPLGEQAGRRRQSPRPAKLSNWAKMSSSPR